jgi:hypothetical protein
VPFDGLLITKSSPKARVGIHSKISFEMRYSQCPTLLPILHLKDILSGGMCVSGASWNGGFIAKQAAIWMSMG